MFEEHRRYEFFFLNSFFEIVNIAFWEEVAKGNIPYPTIETDNIKLAETHIPYSIKSFCQFR
jgi:hypothetical protein